ncbi:MAG TPA: DUF222 domain-containing protein [Galbitalea sp.]
MSTEDLLEIEEPSCVEQVSNALGSLVDGLVETERISARAQAWKVQQVYQLRRFADANVPVSTSPGMRSWSQAATARRTAVSEVAAALRIPERSAETLIEESVMLMERLPLTMAGLSSGDLSFRHAKSVVAHALSLPEELHAAFEQAVVASASTLTVSKFDQRARKVRERMDARTIRERHVKSLADRETWFEPGRDGMGWTHLYHSATVALAAHNRADGIARDLQGPNEDRTLTQLRADVMADLLLDGAVGDRPEFGIRPSVVVTVPVLAMLGHTSKTGEPDLPILEGYGPIDIDTAKELAGAAKSWLRVLTHPETGVTLSVGRDRYKVPAPLRAFLQRRDGTCRKPGCNRAATRCDIDHTQEWQHGGQTAHDNLAHLCPMHHDEKHHTGVTLKHLPNGDIEWSLASGRSYISEPADRFLGIHDFGGAAA